MRFKDGVNLRRHIIFSMIKWERKNTFIKVTMTKYYTDKSTLTVHEIN